MGSLRNLLASCALWSLLIAAVSVAQPANTLQNRIAPQPLAQALAAFANQTGLQVIYVSDIVVAQQSKGAPAGLSPPDALEHLLAETGLEFELLNARTVRIFAPPDVQPTALRVARAARHDRPHPATLSATLREVVVTATRREEQPESIPISMTVWTREAMEKAGIKGMTEIGALTPGVEFDFAPNVGADNFTNLVIRGVTDRHAATTGVYIDDMPLPTERSETFGRSFPSTFDLERVEVMRGPQGVLLGQGTLGGAIRFLFRQPSLTTFDGIAHAEVAATSRGDPSYEAGAAVGGPLIADVLGFRVSGWYRSEGGYVDHIDRFTGATLEENANRLMSKSARAAVTWKPSSSLRITPALTYQSNNQRAQSTFWVDWSDRNAGALRNPSLVLQPSIDTFHLASVKLTETFAFADLTSVTAYFGHSVTAALDFSDEFPLERSGAVTMPYRLSQSAFSQDVRLSSVDPDATLNWTVGIYYSSDHKRETSSMVRGSGPSSDWTRSVANYTQMEGFGQIGIRATRHVTASAGVRIGHSRYAGLTEIPTTSRVAAADHEVTPKFDVSYATDAGSLFYATVGKGYRSGGIYPTLALCEGGDPALFPPDTLWSYEIGAKADFYGGRVHLEPSIFHVEWNNQQPDLLSGHGCNAGLNIRSTAASSGLDLAARVLLTRRLQFALAMAYVDAHYTQTIKLDDAVIVRSGDALGMPPQVPSPWDITASLAYEFPLARDATAELRAEENFHSRNPGPFLTGDPASPLYYPTALPNPATNVLNLRASVRWPSFDMALFVNNALDSRPLLGQSRGCPVCAFDYALTLRPRTIGIAASLQF
jgi:iron complex outermembrane recepter protein